MVPLGPEIFHLHFVERLVSDRILLILDWTVEELSLRLGARDVLPDFLRQVWIIDKLSLKARERRPSFMEVGVIVLEDVDET
jgi:hypothetical protein